MRVGLLTTGYPRWEGDVAGSFVAGFAEALRARGHAVEVFAAAPPEPAASLDARWVRYRRRARDQRTFYGAGAPDNLRRDVQAWPGLIRYPLALRRAVRHAGRFDALVAHFGLPCGLVAAILPARRHLTVWHSADVHLARRLPAPLRARLLGKGMHWFVRESHRRALAGEAASRHLVHPMGATPPPAADREASRTVLGCEGPTVLFLGRLVPVKGVDVLLDALAGSRVQLLVAGEGPERAALERRARELGVRARFLGAVQGARKGQAFAAADVLALPSRRLPSGRTEGAPVVLAEAWLAGLPVVASGVLEGVEDGVDALRVAPEDPRALRDALARLLADPALRQRLREAGRARGEELRWTRLGPRIEALLRGGPGAFRRAACSGSAPRAPRG
ncbi:MAG TPA: glycosyltransferase family 4 protein [Polyangiaceae bacterium LLY-WYZ-15_(1-7)]|nr:glycosyltransferase family 4 protein [Polyangiaceae bacterium LLY-WYZ-15_(1-7)]